MQCQGWCRHGNNSGEINLLPRSKGFLQELDASLHSCGNTVDFLPGIQGSSPQELSLVTSASSSSIPAPVAQSSQERKLWAPGSRAQQEAACSMPGEQHTGHTACCEWNSADWTSVEKHPPEKTESSQLSTEQRAPTQPFLSRLQAHQTCSLVSGWEWLQMAYSILDKWIPSIQILYITSFPRNDTLFWKLEHHLFITCMCDLQKVQQEGFHSHRMGVPRTEVPDSISQLSCLVGGPVLFSSPFQGPVGMSCSNSFFLCWMRHWIKFSKYKLKDISALSGRFVFC